MASVESDSERSGRIDLKGQRMALRIKAAVSGAAIGGIEAPFMAEVQTAGLPHSCVTLI
jgi:hypothetical protein